MLKKYKAYRFWTYLVSISLIILLMNIFPNSKERFIDQTINDFTRGTLQNDNNLDDKLYIFSKPHTHMYGTAYKIFLDNKFFGVGPRQFRNECDDYRVGEYSCETHPHNTYMELLSEGGIFAFFIVFSVFILICFISIKHLMFKLLKKAVLSGVSVSKF